MFLKYKQQPISELGIYIEHEDGIFTKQAVENLNKLFAEIDRQNKGKRHIIILLDEIIVNFDCLDFSTLKLDYPNITVIMAINPAAYNMSKEVLIREPSGSNVLAVQLKTKHRNSYQIGVLLAHINKFIKDQEDAYKCLDATGDEPLNSSYLPSGTLPVWIETSPETTDKQVLDYIKTKLIQEALDVTIVHYQKQFSQEANSWLSKQEKWRVMDHTNMVGSETDCLFAFVENATFNMESFSRARKQLIIITK